MIITIIRQGFLESDKLNVLQYVLHVSLISTYQPLKTFDNSWRKNCIQMNVMKAVFSMSFSLISCDLLPVRVPKYILGQ